MYKPYPWQAVILISLSIIQILLLVMQKQKGARIIIPKYFRPKSYSYIRKIREAEDLETGIIPYVFFISS